MSLKLELKMEKYQFNMPSIPKNRKYKWSPERKLFEGLGNQTQFYNTRTWRNLRLTKLKLNPICELCEKKGIVKAATDVHHIHSFNRAEPFNLENGRYGSPTDLANLQSLCKNCHQKITSKNGTKSKKAGV